jgi:hypothetical protein
MDMFTVDELEALTEAQDGNCVSIYLPTHRTTAEIQADMIRFKNLVRKTQETLVDMGLRKADARNFVEPLRGLLGDRTFWERQSDGLAVFLSVHFFRYYRLPEEFKELLIVGNRFHTKPLLPLIAGDTHFYVLAISQNQVRLVECTRYSATEIDLGSVPKSLSEALKYDDAERQLQFHSGTSAGAGRRPAVFHGHGVGIDDKKNDILRYFRHIDKGLRKILQGKKAPLVPAGVEYLFPIYREANTYTNLFDEGISGNPEGMSADELHSEAWPMVEPYFQQAQSDALARYNQFRGTERVTADLDKVIPAAYHGRVELLFVATGVQQWGRYDSEKNMVETREEAEPDDVELLDFAALQALTNGGAVFALPPEEMPDGALVAALLRY